MPNKSDIVDEYGRKVGELRERNFGGKDVHDARGDVLGSARASGSGYDIVDQYGRTRGSLRPASDASSDFAMGGLAALGIIGVLAAVLIWLTWKWYAFLFRTFLWKGPRWVHRTIRDNGPRKGLAYLALAGYAYWAVLAVIWLVLAAVG